MQNFFGAEDKYIFTSTYTLKTSNYKSIRQNIYLIQQLFPEALVAVAKQLHQIITSEKTFDIPEFPQLKSLAVFQPDLLIAIPLQSYLTNQRIKLKFLQFNFNLVDQVYTYRTSSQVGQSIQTPNGGTYCFYLHFLNSFEHLQQPELDEMTAIRAQKEIDLQSCRLSKFKMMNDELILGFDSQLNDFQVYLRKIYNCFDTEEDLMIQYQQLISSGLFYCLNAQQLKSDSQNEAEQIKFPVSKVGKNWPTKEDAEEEKEPVDEEEQKQEIAEEQHEEALVEEEEHGEEEQKELDENKSVKGKFGDEDLDETQKIDLEGDLGEHDEQKDVEHDENDENPEKGEENEKEEVKEIEINENEELGEAENEPEDKPEQ